MIKWEQMVFLGNPEYGVSLEPIDFVQLRRGVRRRSGSAASGPRKCAPALEAMLLADGPALCEAVVDPFEPPMPARVKAKQALHMAEVAGERRAEPRPHRADAVPRQGHGPEGQRCMRRSRSTRSSRRCGCCPRAGRSAARRRHSAVRRARAADRRDRRSAPADTGMGFGYTIGTGGTAILALLRDQLSASARRPATAAHIVQARRASAQEHPRVDAGMRLVDGARRDRRRAVGSRRSPRATSRCTCCSAARRIACRLYNTHVGWLNRDARRDGGAVQRSGRRDGFTALKLKVGKPDPEEDRERVAKVREAVGGATTLMVDANQSWTIDQAIGRIRRARTLRSLLD